jgi:ABC-type multidrug transport system fused ATPase/permease subunit
VLKDFTMEIPAKKTLGLMGHAGSGKTTLAALLLRQVRFCRHRFPLPVT